MKTVSSLGSVLTDGVNASTSVEGKTSLRRSFLAVDLRGEVPTATTGEATESSPVSVSEAWGCLPTERAVVFRLDAVVGVAGTWLSSVSTVEARALRRDAPRLVPAVDATVDGVGGGGIDSRSSLSLATEVARLPISVIPSLVLLTLSRSRRSFLACGRTSSSRMRISWAFFAEAG